jgi:hypothetical protein
LSNSSFANKLFLPDRKISVWLIKKNQSEKYSDAPKIILGEISSTPSTKKMNKQSCGDLHIVIKRFRQSLTEKTDNSDEPGYSIKYCKALK